MNAEEFQAAVAALELPEDKLAEVLKLNNGLMESNTNLLTESKANKTKAQEANEATELARLEATKAKELELIASGKTDELKAHYEAQLAEGTAAAKLLTEKAVNALTQRDKGEVINSILASVDDRYKAFVKTQLESSVTISYDGSGVALASIKDGDAQYASSTDFLDGVKESDTWKHVLKATTFSGADGRQSKGSGNPAPTNSVQSNLANRLKAQGLT